jgi:hypothetical protein
MSNFKSNVLMALLTLKTSNWKIWFNSNEYYGYIQWCEDRISDAENYIFYQKES